MKIRRFEEIEAWQEARKLVKMVSFAIDRSERFKRDYHLQNQAINAAVSTMSNIAEGFSRRSTKEFIHFLYISKSSSAEVQSIFYVALDMNYVNEKVFKGVYHQADRVSQLDSGFIRYLSNKKLTTQQRPTQ